MKRVYEAPDPVSANILKAHLESGGVEADVQDERTFSLRGDVPVVYPSVWVKDVDVARALELVAEFEKTGKDPAPAQETWTCPTCGETHSTQYTECWKCTSEAESKPEEVSPQEPLISSKWLRWAILGIALVVVVGVAFLVRRQAKKNEIRQCVQAGLDLLNMKRLDEAMEQFAKAIELDATCWQAYYDRALVHGNAERWKDSEADCTAALELSPQAIDVILLRGVVRRQMNDFSGARDDYSRVAYLDETHVKAYEALLKRSDVNYDSGQWPAALADLDRAGELAYTDDRLRLKWGALRVTMGFLEEGMADLDRAARLNPKDVQTWCARGWARLDTGKPELALEDVGEAASLLVKTVTAEMLIIRARALSRLGKREEATTLFKMLASTGDQQVGHFPFRGFARAMVGQFPEALADCERGKKEQPWSCWPEYWIACVLAERSKGHPDDAAGRAACDADIEQGVAHLATALEKGLKYNVHVLNDPELAPLRQHPKFAELKKMQDEARAKTK